MDTIFIPKLGQKCIETAVFRQVSLFTRLSARLSMEVNDKSKSVESKVLMELTKILDKQEVPNVTQILFGAVKAAAFESIKTDGRRDETVEIEIDQRESKEKEDIIPSVLMKKWKLMVKEIKQVIETHRQVIAELQVAQENYWLARNKAYNSEELKIPEQKKAFRIERSSNKSLQKSLDAYKNKQDTYWQLKYWKLVADENKFRQKLKEVAKQLEDEVKERLVQKITDGFTNLERIRNTEKPFSELDYGKIAHDIVLYTSEKYTFALPPSSGFLRRTTPPPNIAPPSSEDSEFAKNYKRSHGSNNIYMKCIKTTTTKSSQDLNLKEGQKLRQKLMSEDGQWAFGWTRKGRFYRKIWGFYPTLSLRMATEEPLS